MRTTPHRTRLCTEPLEDRRLLAVFTVNSLVDAPGLGLPGTLRYAVNLTNLNPGHDTIRFSQFGAGADTLFLPFGSLPISDALTIQGTGQNQLTIFAAGADEAFRVAPGADLTLNDITISGSDNGITNLGTLHVHGTHLTNILRNGIVNTGTLQFDNSRITESHYGVVNDGGQISLVDVTITASNGVDSDGGSANVKRTTISGGISTGIILRGGTLHVDESSITNKSSGITIDDGTAHISNTAIADSLVIGIDVRDGSTVTLADSSVTGSIHRGGIENRGDLDVRSSTISDNSTQYGGGGIYNLGELVVRDSVIASNTSRTNYFGSGGFGGGIRNGGTLAVSNSLIAYNSSDFWGGGIDHRFGDATFQNTTIVGNSSNQGGAISVGDGTFELESSTISGNWARAGKGGGLFLRRGQTHIRFSTITANRASGGDGDGIYQDSELQLQSSIVAGNTGGDDIFDSGVTYSLGHNLIGGVAQGWFGNYGDQVIGTANPGLAELADNGGPLPTHALLPGSPAINGGDPAAVPGLGVFPDFDQRGAPRVKGRRMDIGAVEHDRRIVSGPALDHVLDPPPTPAAPGRAPALTSAVAWQRSADEVHELWGDADDEEDR